MAASELLSKIFYSNYEIPNKISHPEVLLQKVFWKYAAILHENNHAEVRFQ